MSYTKGEWVRGPFGGVYPTNRGIATGPMIAIAATKSGALPNAESNEDRIVACVNAFEGVDDPTAIVASHAALVEALRGLLDAVQDTPAIDSQAAGNAFEVIAKSEGRKAKGETQ